MTDMVERHDPPWECEDHGEDCLLDDNGKLFCAYCQDFAAKDAEIEQAEAEITRLRRIGRALLYHDERGQGVGWQEAMAELAQTVEYDKGKTDD